MLLHGDPGGLMINSGIDRNTFFTEAQQTIDEMRQGTPMVLLLNVYFNINNDICFVFYFICLIF